MPVPSEYEEPGQKKRAMPDTSHSGKVGDWPLLQENSVEIEFGSEKYVIVPFNSILLLQRDKPFE